MNLIIRSAVRRRFCPLLLILSTLFAPALSAHSGATGVVKQRMDAMETMKDEMKVMGSMIKGKRPLELPKFSQSSKTLLKHSSDISRLFPADSGGGKSETLPTIWQQWDLFNQQAKQLHTEAEKQTQLSEEGSDFPKLKQQFSKVAKQCKACHRDYKKEK
ncbi:MAG: cytochrome c [Motiliproteus sp.]